MPGRQPAPAHNMGPTEVTAMHAPEPDLPWLSERGAVAVRGVNRGAMRVRKMAGSHPRPGQRRTARAHPGVRIDGYDLGAPSVALVLPSGRGAGAAHALVLALECVDDPVEAPLTIGQEAPIT